MSGRPANEISETIAGARPDGAVSPPVQITVSSQLSGNNPIGICIIDSICLSSVRLSYLGQLPGYWNAYLCTQKARCLGQCCGCRVPVRVFR